MGLGRQFLKRLQPVLVYATFVLKEIVKPNPVMGADLAAGDIAFLDETNEERAAYV